MCAPKCQGPSPPPPAAEGGSALYRIRENKEDPLQLDLALLPSWGQGSPLPVPPDLPTWTGVRSWAGGRHHTHSGAHVSFTPLLAITAELSQAPSPRCWAPQDLASGGTPHVQPHARCSAHSRGAGVSPALELGLPPSACSGLVGRSLGHPWLQPGSRSGPDPSGPPVSVQSRPQKPVYCASRAPLGSMYQGGGTAQGLPWSLGGWKRPSRSGDSPRGGGTGRQPQKLGL